MISGGSVCLFLLSRLGVNYDAARLGDLESGNVQTSLDRAPDSPH
jgi:hypothetical protein